MSKKAFGAGMEKDRKILIVEDEWFIAQDIKSKVESFGYTVCGTASTGREAVEKTEETLPDMILMDIKLKGEMDGIETAEQIKMMHDIPIVYVTAFAVRELVDRIKKTGPYGYVLKPVRKETLHTAVEIAFYKHEMQKKVDDSTRRLEFLLNSLPVGVVIIDAATQKIIDANPQALTYLGYTLEDLVGKKCNGFICPADVGDCPIIDRGQDVDRSEREILTCDGEILPVLKSVIKTEIDNNELLVECFTDIRDKKRAQEEHVKREKIQAVLELAGAVCHEFNQPLQVIAGHLELLKAELPENSSILEMRIDTMTEEINRMATLTGDLMNITRYRTKPYLRSNILDIKGSSKK